MPTDPTIWESKHFEVTVQVPVGQEDKGREAFVREVRRQTGVTVDFDDLTVERRGGIWRAEGYVAVRNAR